MRSRLGGLVLIGLLLVVYYFLPTGLPLAKGNAHVRQVAGYVNPIGKELTPYRIDQGVDYNGPGDLYAVGSGEIVTISSGWPGTFIALRLDSGTYKGRYVYYAENITPAVRRGKVSAGQLIATVPSCTHCVEIGWAAPPGDGPTLARVLGQATAGSAAGDAGMYPTACGVQFSRLIQELGGTGGLMTSHPVQGSSC